MFHDPWLDAKNDEVLGASGDWLWEEINDVDFGSWYDPRFKDERLPLFEDVLGFARLNGLRLTLDIKENVTPAMVRALLKKHDAERVVYSGWVGNFGSLVGAQRWITEFDGDRERIRQILGHFGGNTVWVDHPRVLLDLLHRDVSKREVKMPPLRLAYRPEELQLDTLVEQVRAGGDQGRIGAARLRKHFRDRASAAFVGILPDEGASAEPKAIAARALGRLADTIRESKKGGKAAELLSGALADSSAELRAAAAYALGKLKHEGAVAGLVAVLRNPEETAKVRAEAARALGRIRSPRAIQPLVETAQLQGAQAGEYLRRFVASTKGYTKEGYFFRDNSAMYWAMPQLLYACYWALGEIGGEPALDFLLAQYEAKQFPEKDRLMEAIFVRARALDAAARIGGARALAAAKAHAWKPPHPTYLDYVRLTRNFPANEVVPVLLEFLGHPNGWQRQEAFYALLRIGEPAIEPLIGLLNDKQASLIARQWAAWTLGWMDDPRVVAALTTALNDRVPGVRAKAAWAMGKLRVQESAKRLEELSKDTDPLVRDYAAEALDRLRRP